MIVLPTMPLAEWLETKETLHRFLQVVGKMRLASRRAPQPLVERAIPPDRPGPDDSHVAVLDYERVRLAEGSRTTAPVFYESAHRAGAELAGWDLGRYACRNGITDPRLSEVVP